MKKNPEPTPIAIFGAKLILRHLDALTVEIEGVRQGQDIEYIHRMRVASRRLRNALPVFINSLPARKINAWGQPIRRITRSLGAARDLDVQLVSLQEFLNQIHTSSQLVPGIRRLILRLEQRRTKIQSRVLTTLAEFEASGTAEDMHTLLDPLAGLQDDQTPPAAELYDLAHSVISSRLVDFFSRSELIRDPANILDLHAQRIAAKHLRYTLELFAPLYPDELKPSLNACRKFQDQLGLIHDCDVWADYLPVFMEEEKQRTAWFYGRRLLEKEKTLGANLKFEDIIEEVAGVYPRIMIDGDMDAGAWSCGMVAGLIHDIPTCKELIDRIMAEADAIISKRLAGFLAA